MNSKKQLKIENIENDFDINENEINSLKAKLKAGKDEDILAGEEINVLHDEIFKNIVITSSENNKNLKSSILSPIERYLEEISRRNLLNKEEEKHYGKLAKEGCIKAKTRMIESNLRLVVKIARRYLSSGMPISDLIEEGNIGLMRAVEKFDPNLGFRFSTYGAIWVQQSIERAIMNQERVVRLPIHVVKQLNSYLKAERKLKANIDNISSKDIAQELNCSRDDVERILMLNEKTISLDLESVNAGSDRPYIDSIISNEEANPTNILITNEIKEKMEIVLDKLSHKQYEVITRRYGLRGQNAATIADVSAATGFSKEKVRQIQYAALLRMREYMSDLGNNLDDLL